MPNPLSPLARIELAPWAGGKLRDAISLNRALEVIGATLGLAGTWLVSNHDAAGFGLWIGSNMALIWLQLRLRMPVLTAMYLAYLAMSVRGLASW